MADTGATGTGTLTGQYIPVYRGLGDPAGTNGSGFDWGQFLQLIGGTGSAIYNAINATGNAQGVANTVDPFTGQRPYYQGLLQKNIGSENPYAALFNTAYGNQQNPYSAQYQQMLGNQQNPYANPIQQAINNQSNPYATMIAKSWGNQDNPYAKQLQGLLTDPNSFKTDPGYQFALSQGQKGIERASNALYGTARTGSLAPELAKYTEGYANQAYSDRIAQLAGLTNAQNQYNANSMNTLANLSGNQNAHNTNFLNSLGSLSGQQQTTNTNQLAQIANLIGNTNQYNLGNLGALTNMFGAQGNQSANFINQLLTASGATTGSPTAAGAAQQSGQQGQAASIGAALQAIPGLAQYVPQILQMIGGGGVSLPTGGLAENPEWEPGGYSVPTPEANLPQWGEPNWGDPNFEF